MIILTIVSSYILCFFPCENDTLDTLDMSPFGSTRIPPFDIYTDIHFPWGNPTDPHPSGGVNAPRLTASRSLSRGPGTLTVDGGLTNRVGPSNWCQMDGKVCHSETV